MPTIWNGTSRKVIVSRKEVANFNSTWPLSKLYPTRSYWFEFDENGDLIDTDVPEHSDGREAWALSEDCRAFLFDNVTPDWAE